MKQIIKSMMLLAAAAGALTACNKEVDVQETAKTDGTGTIRFYAVVDEAETRATLTTEDEKTFKAAWEEGDQIRMYGSHGTGDDFAFLGSVAEYKGEYFEIPDVDDERNVLATWSYEATFPVIDGNPFGNERVQSGNLYSSQYDFMAAVLTVENAKFGVDSEGKPLVFPMERKSSILYFHLTSDLEETLASATLTVEGGDIAADRVSLDYVDGLETESNVAKYDNITITFAEGTAPSAKDFCLWYNILPVSATGLKLTVTTTSGKTATLTNTKGKTYAAGKLNKIVKSGLTWEDGPFFYESFDQTTGTGGNDDQWKGSIASSTLTPDNEGWLFEKEGGAKQCAKFGTGSAKGSATTPALSITSDFATLTFKAGAWNGDGTVLLLSIEGNGILSEESVTMLNNAWSDYTITIAGADKNTKVKFYTSNVSRFFLDEIKVVEGGTTFDYLSVPEEVTVDYSATSASFEIKTGSAWTISGADDVDIDKTSGTGNETVTLTFPENTTASDITIATLTITAGEKTSTVVVKQAGNPDAIEELTIDQFLAKEVSDAYYRLTGTVTNIVGAEYGNFTLVDETGSVYVYGLTKTKVTSNDKSFASIGVEDGDVVTLEGTRSDYKGTPQVGGPAYYISHVKAPSVSVDPTSLVFGADGGTETVTAAVANFTGSTVTITAESDNAQFSTSVSGTTISVTAAENTGDKVETGNITITATDGVATKTATVSVSQNKPVRPASDGDVLWQEDFTGYGTTMPATATGAHVYGEGTVSYTLTKGSSDTKLYNEKLAGGTSPEILISKSNGSFKVSGIPTGNAAAATVTFKLNNDYVTVIPSTGVTVREDASFENKVKTVVIDIAAGTSSFDLEFKNTSNSNCRADNFSVVVGAPKVKKSQTITFGDTKSFEWIIGTDCTLEVAKQGPTVTGAQTTVSYQSSDRTIAMVDNDGKVTPLKKGTVTITATAEETEDYKEAKDSYSLKITDPNSGTVSKKNVSIR